MEPLRGEDDTARMVAISFSFVPFFAVCNVICYTQTLRRRYKTYVRYAYYAQWIEPQSLSYTIV